MEKFKKLGAEIEQETTENVIEHGGLERLEKELEKSAAEKRERPAKEKIELEPITPKKYPEELETETKQKQTSKKKLPEGFAKEVLEMKYYDPDAWGKLREQSRETHEEILLKKSENLAERYLAGTATAEEKVLLDELKERNQGELTDVWVKKSASYLNPYREPEIPHKVIESWLILTAPNEELRPAKDSLIWALGRVLPDIIHKRLDEIIRLTKEKNERPENMEEIIPKLLHEKEVVSKILSNLEGSFNRTPVRSFLKIIFAWGDLPTFAILCKIRDLRKEYRKTLKGKPYKQSIG